MCPRTVDVFQAIADPSRRQILRLLARESQSINTLANNFNMSRPAVSKHISILQCAGFISIENIGRERYCTLSKNGFTDLQQWLGFFDAFWQSNLVKLEALLRREKGSK
ncbi:ArsR/SmtB family transcription factor [Deminuibacter soli]|uniref:Transcriptional regulator n=1 Tax=Deminuibacter soli TaxID=2291815 RepID=A0A3E1NIQ2_9BACT|nr:metalloregulator ArsR/SmtB family transcription factor [Deminuibacter soli]RFM27792.1 transcriptional regulator [Deminuibacter soli]